MEQEYFPSLEKCFSVDVNLISWAQVSRRLLQRSHLAPDDPILAFLPLTESKDLLLSARAGFPAASASSKSAFDSKTTAINITSSAGGHYDLDEIRKDALWLSDTVKIDQVTALRIVVLEWQQRPRLKLQCCYSEAELASIRDAAGTDSYNIASWAGSEAFSRQSQELAAEFNTAESRASRLLLLYLGERKGLLVTSKWLYERVVSKRPLVADEQSSKGKGTLQAATTTLEELGLSIVGRDRHGSSRAQSEQYVVACVDAMQMRLAGLETGSGWFEAEGGRAEVESSWMKTNLQEISLIMDNLLLHLCMFRYILGSQPLLCWLRLVHRLDFFAAFEPQTEEQIPLINSLRASTSFVSLALLDVLSSISHVAPSGDAELVDLHSEERSFYFFDHENITEIQEIMLSAARSCNIPASPAVFAWGMILYTVQELALSSKEAREGHHVQKAIDHIAISDSGTSRRHSGSSTGSTQQSLYEDVMDAVRVVSIGEDPIEYLMKSAVDGSHVFDVVGMLAKDACSGDSMESYCKGTLLQDLVSVAVGPLGYTPEILTAELAILSTPESYSASSHQYCQDVNLRADFLVNEFLMGTIFDVAISRFPYEMLPCLELCKALVADSGDEVDGFSKVLQRLRSLKTFSQAVTDGFSAYHTIREDENADLVSLDRSLEMLGSRQGSGQGLIEFGNSQEDSVDNYLIPADTVGQVISEAMPTVIMWYHQYSGLNYLGKWLEQYQIGLDLTSVSLESVHVIAAEIVDLFSVMIRTAYRAQGTSLSAAERADIADKILEEASEGFDGGVDVVSIVFDIFEKELQGLRYRRTSDRSLQLALACINFVAALIDLAPNRVWSSLARSSLLRTRGGDSVLSVLVNSVEAVSGNFDFLERIISLYDALVEDAVCGAVRRTTSKSLPGTRASGLHNQTDTSAHFTSQTLLSLTQALIEIHDSIQSWKFNSTEQKIRLNITMTATFSNVIKYSYATDDRADLAQKMTANVAPAALHIVNHFCASANLDGSSTTLLRLLINGLRVTDLTTQYLSSVVDASTQQTIAVLDFCFLLIRANAFLGRSPPSLLSQLLNAFAILVRLCVSENSLEVPALALMDELLRGVSAAETGPLLGYLGSESSIQFLDILASFVEPLSDKSIFEAAWRLLTSLVENHQQWFAVVLLTGSSPHGRLQQAGQGVDAVSQNKLRGKPFLATALDSLSHIDDIMSSQATVLLEFVNKAQESWTWTTNHLHSHPNFISAITNYVSSRRISESELLDQCSNNKIASLISDLMTVYLHHAKAARDASVIMKMIPLIAWLSNYAIDVSGYNSSLHGNLRQNFATRYPCSLSNFKRTTLVPAAYSNEYFYDTKLGSKLLGFDPSWAGRDKGGDQGFLAEFARVNVNLSLVDSQLVLLNSFKRLSIEHSAFFVQDREVQKMMAQVVGKCLQANTRVYPEEKIFEALFQTRADFALALTQRLVDVKAKGSSFVTLLEKAWETIRFRNPTYESAIINDDLRYYRSLLTILLLTMQFHVDKRSKSNHTTLNNASTTTTADPIVPIVLGVAETVIARGVISVTSNIYDQGQTKAAVSGTVDDETMVGTRDLILVLSLLETVLRLPLLPQIISQLSGICSSLGVAESCLLLYSWSHVLTRSKASNQNPHNPVYADISLRILVALSSLPLIAEELAVEGVLSRLSTARMTQALQSCPGGVLPLDNRGTQYQALYVLWSTGILPLCLNLLHSVGRPMAGEISTFLNQFPSQLSRTSTAFSYSSFNQNNETNKGVITLALANEATTMALISHILAEYRAAGASAGVDALDIPNLEGYDEHRKVLVEELKDLVGRPAIVRSRVMASDTREQLWLKDGRLETKIMEELKRTATCLRGIEGEEE